MGENLIRQIKSAITSLNPLEVRATAERSIHIGLSASTSAGFSAMEDFLAPSSISRGKRLEVVELVHRVGDPGGPDEYDIEISEEGELSSGDGFFFSRHQPELLVKEILARRQDLGLPLARNFPAFRKPVVSRINQEISKENALLAMLTALPDVVPTLFQLPWAAGEFASSTALLTMNQVRMAFLIAGASDRPIGYREQKNEIASIIAGAFGWRTLARELVGKIPFGGGLIPKASIAFAGTYVVGLGLERYYRIGYGFTRGERHLAYQEALERGAEVAHSLLAGLKGRNQS